MQSATPNLERRQPAIRSQAAARPQQIRLAIISTHPIQYHGHWFRALAARPELDLHVFYCYDPSPSDQARAGFGVEFEWDIPLLAGYRYTFLNRRFKQPAELLAPSLPQILQALERDHYDAVLVNGWHYKAAWQTIFACWKLGIPVMVRGDSQLASPRSAVKRLLKYPLYRSFIPRFDACLAVGTRSHDYYMHYGADPQRVFVVPHAVQDDLFHPPADDAQLPRKTVRRKWGLQDQQTVFLFAGKFIEPKRPLDFLRAMEAAARKEPAIAGLMVGDGPLRSGCEEFVNSRQLPVRFTGFLNQSRMVEAYAACDCLVLPSNWESWGLVVNEAMSCSRPAVVSDAVGCAPDLVHDGRTGAVFPAGNVDALTEILIAFGGDPEGLRDMGQHARAALRPYSLDAAVQGVLDAAEAVTKGVTK